MLKIVYPICCGIDVHKKFVVATVASTNKSGVTDYQTRQFSTFTENLHQLLDWLKSQSCINVKKDSIWLCDLHKHGLVPSSFIPPLLIRQIRDLMRYRFKLINFKSSEKIVFKILLPIL